MIKTRFLIKFDQSKRANVEVAICEIIDIVAISLLILYVIKNNFLNFLNLL